MLRDFVDARLGEDQLNWELRRFIRCIDDKDLCMLRDFNLSMRAQAKISQFTVAFVHVWMNQQQQCSLATTCTDQLIYLWHYSTAPSYKWCVVLSFSHNMHGKLAPACVMGTSWCLVGRYISAGPAWTHYARDRTFIIGNGSDVMHRVLQIEIFCIIILISLGYMHGTSSLLG